MSEIRINVFNYFAKSAISLQNSNIFLRYTLYLFMKVNKGKKNFSATLAQFFFSLCSYFPHMSFFTS